VFTKDNSLDHLVVYWRGQPIYKRYHDGQPSWIFDKPGWLPYRLPERNIVTATTASKT